MSSDPSKQPINELVAEVIDRAKELKVRQVFEVIWALKFTTAWMLVAAIASSFLFGMKMGNNGPATSEYALSFVAPDEYLPELLDAEFDSMSIFEYSDAIESVKERGSAGTHFELALEDATNPYLPYVGKRL